MHPLFSEVPFISVRIAVTAALPAAPVRPVLRNFFRKIWPFDFFGLYLQSQSGCFPSGLFCGNSSVGRAQPCQGWGREFESRFPLRRSFTKDLFLLGIRPRIETAVFDVFYFTIIYLVVPAVLQFRFFRISARSPCLRRGMSKYIKGYTIIHNTSNSDWGLKPFVAFGRQVRTRTNMQYRRQDGLSAVSAKLPCYCSTAIFSTGCICTLSSGREWYFTLAKSISVRSMQRMVLL